MFYKRKGKTNFDLRWTVPLKSPPWISGYGAVTLLFVCYSWIPGLNWTLFWWFVVQVHKFLDKNFDTVRQDVLDLFIQSKNKVRCFDRLTYDFLSLIVLTFTVFNFLFSVKYYDCYSSSCVVGVWHNVCFDFCFYLFCWDPLSYYCFQSGIHFSWH